MLNKIVNGVEVQCSSDEEAEIRAEWADNEKNKPELIPEKTLIEQILASPADLAALKQALGI